jgi:hypothetical protein
LPWTALAAAALKRAWREVRVPARAPAAGSPGSAWRFAAAASLPFLALLSFAATARDVYAAPAMLGFAVLIGLWSNGLARQTTRFDAVALAVTRALVAALVCSFAVALGVLAAVEDHAAKVAVDLGAAAAVLALTLIALRYAARLQQARSYAASIIATYGGYALALVASGVLVLPTIDRWQNLGALAQRIERDAAGGELAVLNPDETTIAMLDYRARTAFVSLTVPPPEASRLIAAWLGSRGAQAHVLVMLPGHARGAVTELLGHWFPLAPQTDGIAGTLAAAGSARITGRYELPQGRRYALLGPSTR